MSTIKISSIVHIFLEDPHFISNWIKLADVLDTPSTEIQSLRRQRNCDFISAHEVLRNILSSWKSRTGKGATIDSLSDFLHNLGFIDIKEKLEDYTKLLIKPVILKDNDPNSDSSSDYSSKQQIFYGIEGPIKSFIGRKEKLKELDDLIQNTKLSAVIISGLGGMGKSQLVRKYLTLNKSNHPICNWVNGETAETLQSSFEQFAAYLNVPTTDKQNGKPLQLLSIVKNVLHNVKEKMTLFSKGNYIIVIDNVDDLYEDFKKVTRQICSYSRSTVIITSRRRDVLSGESECLDLSEWNKEDAMEYVNLSLNIPKQEAELLCSTLQFYPLALSQAVAYIRQQQRMSLHLENYSVADYLEDYKSKGELLLNKSHEISAYEKTSLVVINITIDQMKKYHGEVGPVAYSCLELFTLLNPDGIHLQFLKHLLQVLVQKGLRKPEELDKEIMSAVQLLVHYSLISVKDSVASIHRVVQKVIRLRSQESRQPCFVPLFIWRFLNNLKNETRQTEVLDAILQTLHPWINKNSKSEMVHILNIMDHTLNHMSLVEKYSELTVEVSNQLWDLHMGKELLTFSTKYHSTFKNSVGQKHATTLAMKHALGRSLHLLGMWEEAEKVLEEVYSQRRTDLGDSHVKTLVAAHNYSSLLLDLDRNQEAYKISKKTYEQKVIVYGKDSDRAMSTLSIKASSLLKLGKLAAAQVIYEKMLDYYSKKYEKTHPDILRAQHNLAIILYNNGEYTEARSLLRVVVQGQYANEYSDEVSAAMSMYYIALCDLKLGRVKEALQGFEHVLEIRKKELGEAHPHTINVVNQISEIKNTI